MSSESYLSEDEANVALQKLTGEFTHKVCPLLRGPCRINCVSFYPGRVIEIVSYQSVKQKNIVFKLDKPECNNALITGLIYNQED